MWSKSAPHEALIVKLKYGNRHIWGIKLAFFAIFMTLMIREVSTADLVTYTSSKTVSAGEIASQNAEEITNAKKE